LTRRPVRDERRRVYSFIPAILLSLYGGLFAALGQNLVLEPGLAWEWDVAGVFSSSFIALSPIVAAALFFAGRWATDNHYGLFLIWFVPFGRRSLRAMMMTVTTLLVLRFDATLMRANRNEAATKPSPFFLRFVSRALRRRAAVLRSANLFTTIGRTAMPSTRS